MNTGKLSAGKFNNQTRDEHENNNLRCGKGGGCLDHNCVRVINNTGRISDKTRQKVMNVMNEMAYTPMFTPRR